MIDMSARESHFVDHLAPIWWALPEQDRGTFWVSESVAGHADALGLPVRVGGPEKAAWPVVVASWGDFRLVRTHSRPIILSEHGAGQSYVGRRHPSYVGGRGRERATLFLVPNFQAAARNRTAWPRIPNVVIGSARVDDLSTIPLPAGPVTVAISFHWRCAVVAEAGTALDHYRHVLADVRTRLASQGVTLIGHGHPRILGRELAAIYDQAGIETVTRFEDVVHRAGLYVCDNSSTLFEFAALDRPVVVLNSPRYRRRAHHGLRFWDEAAVGLNVDQPDQLAGTILAAFDDPPAQRQARQDSVGRVYPVRNCSARVAADTILGVAEPVKGVA